MEGGEFVSLGWMDISLLQGSQPLGSCPQDSDTEEREKYITYRYVSLHLDSGSPKVVHAVP